LTPGPISNPIRPDPENIRSPKTSVKKPNVRKTTLSPSRRYLAGAVGQYVNGSRNNPSKRSSGNERRYMDSAWHMYMQADPSSSRHLRKVGEPEKRFALSQFTGSSLESTQPELKTVERRKKGKSSERNGRN
jgi:hypothetical protein